MVNKLLIYCFLVLGSFFTVRTANAQCAHNPTVTGDTLMCPNGTGMLSTQVYDSYQWYKRLYSDTTLVLIPGATSQTLAITGADDVLYYFAVEATLGGCTEMSPEALVDGWVFASISVSTTGDFTITGTGSLEICTGDTAYLNVLMPYDTNVVWYDGGNAIAGQTEPTLVVTGSGSFTVSAAPHQCPDYSQFMFNDIVVNAITCTTDCNHNPTVFGDTLLCPDGTGTLSTQVYDSYQWYKRMYSDTVLAPIVGATAQTLDITYFDDVLFYFAVEATLNGCTEMSPEALVDGHAFASISVSSQGDFSIGNNGQLLVCTGDTVFLEVLLPYDTNVVWYDMGEAIIGQTDPTLVVTGSGSFTVSAAPSLCPDFTQFMFNDIVVEVDECSTAGIKENEDVTVSVYPNPASDYIMLQSQSGAIVRYRLLNAVGQIMDASNVQQDITTIDISGYSKGTYLLEIYTQNGKQVHTVLKY